MWAFAKFSHRKNLSLLTNLNSDQSNYTLHIGSNWHYKSLVRFEHREKMRDGGILSIHWFIMIFTTTTNLVRQMQVPSRWLSCSSLSYFWSNEVEALEGSTIVHSSPLIYCLEHPKGSHSQLLLLFSLQSLCWKTIPLFIINVTSNMLFKKTFELTKNYLINRKLGIH